ncbi:MAG TPA: hypothetical protein VFY29_19295, partial [Terriglobia bacterium]|nr:hypothetical protein [Terriglobia bacterium]
MNYSEAFEAVQHGDYSSAAPLLAQAATETHYTSDAINQALILALHRTGESARAVEVALSVGVDRAEDSPGMALDYFQRALIAGLDSVRAREIGVIQERWAEQERWADAAPERAHGGAVRRVANVVGELAVSSPAARYTRTLCEGFRS